MFSHNFIYESLVDTVLILKEIAIYMRIVIDYLLSNKKLDTYIKAVKMTGVILLLS